MIPAMTGIPNEQNKDEFLTITNVQSSYLVSISYLIQIFGSLLSGNGFYLISQFCVIFIPTVLSYYYLFPSQGVLTDPIGRKKAMIFVNIPFIIGWFLLYQATQIWHLFFGLSVLGLAIGLMEASVMTYVGEVW